ncbi:hypothetical protein [Paracoccus shanxieyensis]|uniref:Uncharacterized protein n=1 Tax=Paracoccus shanxieyensis TaxID=2675752 RepID=A0A6L6IUI1_9RHOB|nr:hypothetical protein [Paracoccus shanxieyensis]MTH63833.1 hypothetical protein [Paracoccus shanxieyensis]MTH86655.1 hypothetical protein [Paracoccus shanxieyensis]
MPSTSSPGRKPPAFYDVPLQDVPERQRFLRAWTLGKQVRKTAENLARLVVGLTHQMLQFSQRNASPPPEQSRKPASAGHHGRSQRSARYFGSVIAIAVPSNPADASPTLASSATRMSNSEKLKAGSQDPFP